MICALSRLVTMMPKRAVLCTVFQSLRDKLHCKGVSRKFHPYRGGCHRFTMRVTNSGAGDYTIDFGFEVDDRFISVTATSGALAGRPGFVSTVCLNRIASWGCNNTITPNKVEVTIMCANKILCTVTISRMTRFS
jgi:hypothetical protein